MTIQSVIFGTLIAALLGFVFHLWKGGGLGRMVLYLLLSLIGFWAGHLLGAALNWTFANIGPLHLGTAILGSLAVLGIGYWLSLVQVEKKPERRR
jgi:hypothetical protein